MDLSPTRPEAAGDLGAVASTHWLATQTGMSVLERGGNAVDAAVAAGFVLQVAEPHLNGPGGDLPVLLWSATDGTAHVVCGQGTAPAAATPEAFAALGLTAVPGTGPLAAVVPGAFGGWLELLRRWGTWPLRDVLAPAVGYARDGVPVLPRVAKVLAAVAPMFRAGWPTSAEVWLPGGAPPAAWARFRQPALAATYERVVAEAEAAGADRDAQLEAARRAWYEGFVAEAVDRFCRGTPWPDTSGRAHGGLLTGADLAGWSAGVEAPVRARYRDVEFLKTGPWGQGPVLLQQLRLLDALGLPDERDPAWPHLVLEAMKLAFADREAWYGDAGPVPLDDLLSDAYTAERAALVDPGSAFSELRPGSPGGRTPRLPAALPDGLGGTGDVPGALGTGEPTRGDTVHLDVADRWGNFVSATPSGGWLQSSPVIPELGFPLGTRAQMFWLEPGLPASLRPGTRPRTTLSPTLALRDDGRPWVAFGTPGGDQQDQWSLLLALRLAHGGRDTDLALQRAIDAPMLHSEHAPSSFYPRRAHPGRAVLESRWPEATVAELRRLGHDVELSGPWSLGRLSAVAHDGTWFRAAADPRSAQSSAAVR